jgi:hypothetical protein
VVEPVVDAALESHPDWAIRACQAQAERIMNGGQSKYYRMGTMLMRRHRPSRRQQGGRLCFAWFTPDQWSILKETAADPEGLHDTYAEWLEAATQKFEEFQAMGFDVCKLDVDVAKLIQWCAGRGIPNDGKSRSQFAAAHAPSGKPTE